MERREEMTLADFINACPSDCDYQWYDLLEIDEIREVNARAIESGDFDEADRLVGQFIRENKACTVSVYWPQHATRRGISSDCTCALV